MTTIPAPTGFKAWHPELGEAKPEALIYQHGGHGRYAFIKWHGRDDAAVRALFAALKVRPRHIELAGDRDLVPAAVAAWPTGRWSALVTWDACRKLEAWTAAELLLD